MRQLVLKVCALIVALGVVGFVVRANRVQGRELATAPPLPSAPTSAAARDAGATSPPLQGDHHGVIGPATKADPHAVRRAVESLVAPPSPTPAAP